MADLTGMRALVSGGGTGIGLGCAPGLLAAGADVTIVGRRADALDMMVRCAAIELAPRA